MADTIDARRRSWNMARIRSKDTTPELYLRALLHRSGFRFRLHRKDLPGKPDLVLPRFQMAVFVHGCFWHGHGCGSRKAHVPKSNTNYWLPKIAGNVARDRRRTAELRSEGWRTRVLWECEIEKAALRLIKDLKARLE